MVVIKKEIFQRLKTSIPFFKGFSDEEIIAFLRLMKSEKYDEGDEVFKEFEPGDKMYIILTGEVCITKRVGKQGGKDKNTELATLQAGECFGELGLIDQRARSASAYAKGSAFLFSINSKTLYNVCNNPKFSRLGVKLYRNFSVMLAKRLRESNDKYVGLTFELESQKHR